MERINADRFSKYKWSELGKDYCWYIAEFSKDQRNIVKIHNAYDVPNGQEDELP